METEELFSLLFYLVIIGILLFSGLLISYQRNKSEAKAKRYMIIAAVYLLIGLGICGSLLT